MTAAVSSGRRAIGPVFSLPASVSLISGKGRRKAEHVTGGNLAAENKQTTRLVISGLSYTHFHKKCERSVDLSSFYGEYIIICAVEYSGIRVIYFVLLMYSKCAVWCMYPIAKEGTKTKYVLHIYT